MGRVPPAVVKRGKFDHIEERLRGIEGGGDYAFANMAKLYLVPDVVIPPKFKVPDFDKYKGTTCPRKIGASQKMKSC